MAGGRKTSLGGHTFETCIKAMQLKGFEVLNYKQYMRIKSVSSHERMLIKRWPYTTIFGTDGHREYYIHSPEWSGQLECKFQNESGSVDEKMLYLCETLKRTKETHLAVIHGGQYWTKFSRGRAVIEWMQNEARALGHQMGKVLLVMDLDTFFKWVNRTWKSPSAPSK